MGVHSRPQIAPTSAKASRAWLVPSGRRLTGGSSGGKQAQTPTGRLIKDEYFLADAGSAVDRTNPDFSPIFGDLRGLPPLLMVIGEDDILFEDNLAMAARLLASGVEVDLRVYPASPHAFTGNATSMAQAALDGIDEWLRTEFALAR